MMLTGSLRLVMLAAVLFWTASPVSAQSTTVDFNRDVRPILSDICFKCHGPDAAQRATSMRLDTREGVFAAATDGTPIVPGETGQSEVYRRITSQDDEVRMPPPDSGRVLSEQQIETLTRWIEEGAPWQQHWAFEPLQRPPLPEAAGGAEPLHPIDAFVARRLKSAGLFPAPPAEEATQIRRVTLSLTGLPPTPQEVDGYVKDGSDSAWERVVDRLLASPHYGERMAIDWLDAARYADTSGYQTDGPRDMWRWRDWVIAAFNDNMPFDQFTIEQLAGDLLPSPTLDQRIATGFNRNHRGNAEGGIVPEEYQVEYVVDRVDTTATVWLGLTMGCARCHDHKYDPISQKEFYQFYAFFNNIPESGRAIKEGNSPPYVKAPTAEQQQQLDALDAEILQAAAAVDALAVEQVAAQREWEASDPVVADDEWTITDGLTHRFRLDGNLADASSSSSAGATWTDERFAAGRRGGVAEFHGSEPIVAGDVGNFGYFDKFSLTAWVCPADATGTIVSRMVPGDEGSGYCVHLQNGHVQVNLLKRWLDDSLRVETVQPIELDEWHHLTVTYDGSRLARGVAVYLDGVPLDLEVRLDALNQSFATTEPFRIGGGLSSFTGQIGDVSIYDRVLAAADVAVIAEPATVAKILSRDLPDHTPSQAAKLDRYYLEREAAPPIREAHQRLTTLRRARENFYEAVPTVMVMEDSEPRQTHVLIRGQYDAPADAVNPGVPSVFPPLPAGAAADRLGLARWLVAAEHPLTARVLVNRIWQLHFGQGLVKSPEDFGAQGARPSHPELLDWLATEFVRSGWDVKGLHKLIVTSDTYRQSSELSDEVREQDPENRLLSRGPRFRLSAEVIRDQALSAAGLLTPGIGGPSVYPYQPEGLWKDIATTTVYEQSHGDDLYRRSLYTYWKRTVAPPTMATLDATAREACTVRRSRTNTPLQSLALMNEVTFVEAARVLAQNLLAESGLTSEARISAAFQRLTGRRPDPDEAVILNNAFVRYRGSFENDAAAADKLVAVGEFPTDESLDRKDFAALTTLVSLMLNLDEVLTLE